MRTSALVIAILVISAAAQAATLSGMVYHDADRSSISLYQQHIGPEDVLLPDIEARLIGVSDELFSVTDAAGMFSFHGLETGAYLMDFGISPDHDCTSNNRSPAAVDAVDNGFVHIVTIGDSIGAYGSDSLYPERLGLRFADLADVEVTNLAIGGTTTWQWLPGAETGYFDDRLAPILPDADILTISLGGNDLNPYVEGMPPYDPEQIIRNFLAHPEYLFQVIPNSKEIAEAAREINPDCDVVYVVYPNYGNSTGIRELMGDLHPLASFAIGIALTIIRDEIGGVDAIVLADMFGAMGDEMLDPYLLDLVHLNDAGHQLLADIIFLSLGGVIIEEDLDEERLVGFYAPDLVPEDDDDDISDDDDDISDDDDLSDDDDITDEVEGDDDEGCCG